MAIKKQHFLYKENYIFKNIFIIFNQMGVKNLFKLITQNAPNSITSKNIKDYSGKCIVLDASMIIYQYVIAIRSSGSDLQDNKGNLTSHILGVLSKAFMLLKYDIIPIFVFDGKPPEIKYNTIKNRKKIRKKNLEKMESASEEDKVKYFKRSFSITKKQTDEAKEILKLFGVPVIEAPSEADPLCALITKNGNAYGVGSEDMDLLAFGSSNLIRNLSGRKKVIEINLSSILDEMKLKQDEFIDLCILLGCDYSNTIPKIGPKRALDIINKHKSIDSFLENDEKVKSEYYKIPEDFNYKEARDFFKNPPVKKVNKNELKLKKPKYNKIKEIMVDKYNFKLNQVNKYMNIIKSAYNNCSKNMPKQLKRYTVKTEA